MKQNGVSVSLFQLIASFLSGRFQRVIPSDQASDRKAIQAGIIQGTILKFTNDLTNNLKSNIKLFADNNSLFSGVSGSLEATTVLNDDLRKIYKWAKQWKMAFNPDPKNIQGSN